MRNLALSVVLMTSLSAFAQEPVQPQMGFFTGVTNASGTTGVSAGLNFEYRTKMWKDHIGTGIFADFALLDPLTTKLLPAVFVHPWCRLKLWLATGLEFQGGNREVLFRTGAGYEIKIGSLLIGPVASFDFIDGQTARVLGMNFGYPLNF